MGVEPAPGRIKAIVGVLFLGEEEDTVLADHALQVPVLSGQSRAGADDEELIAPRQCPVEQVLVTRLGRAEDSDALPFQRLLLGHVASFTWV